MKPEELHVIGFEFLNHKESRKCCQRIKVRQEASEMPKRHHDWFCSEINEESKLEGETTTKSCRDDKIWPNSQKVEWLQVAMPLTSTKSFYDPIVMTHNWANDSSLTSIMVRLQRCLVFILAKVLVQVWVHAFVVILLRVIHDERITSSETRCLLRLRGGFICWFSSRGCFSVAECLGILFAYEDLVGRLWRRRISAEFIFLRRNHHFFIIISMAPLLCRCCFSFFSTLSRSKFSFAKLFFASLRLAQFNASAAIIELICSFLFPLSIPLNDGGRLRKTQKQLTNKFAKSSGCFCFFFFA